MANPQRENGHLDIANELVEALAGIRIPGEAMQVLWVIFRKTYGFNKKWDWISLSQFRKATKMAKSSIVRGLDTLRQMNLITKRRNSVYEKVNGKAPTYSFNKDYETWKPLAKKQTLTKKLTSVNENVNLPFTKKLPTNTNITNTNNTNTKRELVFLKKLNRGDGFTKELTHLKVTIEYLEELKAEFPKLDPGKELLKAEEWLDDNPGRRPVKHHAFLRGWFERAEERRRQCVDYKPEKKRWIEREMEKIRYQ